MEEELGAMNLKTNELNNIDEEIKNLRKIIPYFEELEEELIFLPKLVAIDNLRDQLEETNLCGLLEDLVPRETIPENDSKTDPKLKCRGDILELERINQNRREYSTIRSKVKTIDRKFWLEINENKDFGKLCVEKTSIGQVGEFIYVNVYGIMMNVLYSLYAIIHICKQVKVYCNRYITCKKVDDIEIFPLIWEKANPTIIYLKSSNFVRTTGKIVFPHTEENDNDEYLDPSYLPVNSINFTQSKKSNRIGVFLVTPEGQLLSLWAYGDEIVRNFKERTRDKYGPYCRDLILYFGAKVLQEDKIIMDYGLQEGSTVFSSWPLAGGKKGEKSPKQDTSQFDEENIYVSFKENIELFEEAKQWIESEDVYNLFTDGACRINFGTAAGYIIYTNRGEEIYSNSLPLEVETNNLAEYMGFIFGLKSALNLGIKKIKVHSDSELLVNQINEVYKVRNACLQALHKEATNLIKHFIEAQVVWVPRAENSCADRLAAKGIKEEHKSSSKRPKLKQHDSNKRGVTEVKQQEKISGRQVIQGEEEDIFPFRSKRKAREVSNIEEELPTVEKKSVENAQRTLEEFFKKEELTQNEYSEEIIEELLRRDREKVSMNPNRERMEEERKITDPMRIVPSAENRGIAEQLKTVSNVNVPENEVHNFAATTFGVGNDQQDTPKSRNPGSINFLNNGLRENTGIVPVGLRPDEIIDGRGFSLEQIYLAMSYFYGQSMEQEKKLWYLRDINSNVVDKTMELNATVDSLVAYGAYSIEPWKQEISSLTLGILGGAKKLESYVDATVGGCVELESRVNQLINEVISLKRENEDLKTQLGKAKLWVTYFKAKNECKMEEEIRKNEEKCSQFGEVDRALEEIRILIEEGKDKTKDEVRKLEGLIGAKASKDQYEKDIKHLYESLNALHREVKSSREQLRPELDKTLASEVKVEEKNNKIDRRAASHLDSKGPYERELHEIPRNDLHNSSNGKRTGAKTLYICRSRGNTQYLNEEEFRDWKLENQNGYYSRTHNGRQGYRRFGESFRRGERRGEQREDEGKWPNKKYHSYWRGPNKGYNWRDETSDCTGWQKNGRKRSGNWFESSGSEDWSPSSF